jgi:HAD superfamily hydrolase (TIGR01549 family)
MEIQDLIRKVFEAMWRDYGNPAYYERFPAVRDYLEKLSAPLTLSPREQTLVEHVFALHEVSTVSATHAQVLHKLSQTHRLGVVSNIFSTSRMFLQEFERMGIRELFEVIVFSSDYGPMKPAATLFEKALQAFPVNRSEVVFVGDSLVNDIVGAQSVGLATVWIDHHSGKKRENTSLSVSPDWVIHDVADLLEGRQENFY